MLILTTGAGSGLGRHIHENLGGIRLSRLASMQEREKIKGQEVDVIIHCAFDSSRTINSDSLDKYIQDNIFFTNELVSFPHKKFIYISSVDVYPKDGNLHSEDEAIDVNSVNGIYGITKLMSESIIRKHCKDYLILRPSALLGIYSKKNSLIKMIEDKDCSLTLSSNSRFNYVLHSDVLDLIKFAIDQDLKGIYNIATSKSITLSEIAELLGKEVKFGNFFYDVGNIDNSKVTSVFPAFKKTSKEVITQFIRTRHG